QPMRFLTPKRFDGLLCVYRSGLQLVAVFACMVALTLLPGCTKRTPGGGVQEGVIKLSDSNIEYFSRGEGEAIVLLPAGTLTVGYLDGVADALAKSGYRVVGINFR